MVRNQPPPTLQNEFKQYIEEQDAKSIAAKLRNDRSCCRNAGPQPSLLALYLPPISTNKGKAIASCLAPDSTIPAAVQQLWYEGLVDGIKAHLSRFSVLDYLFVSNDDTLPSFPRSRAADQEPQGQTRFCYICRLKTNVSKLHALYQSLCQVCGDFNLAESELSAPENLNLKGKTALVTGGRVNLGFYTALRLLRCGSNVIVSTRYPKDAERRFLAQIDVEKWRDRLAIIGADFRSARDAFRLANYVRDQVASWNERGRLDILINNAAQTLTDSLAAENMAVQRERHLLTLSSSATPESLSSDDRYQLTSLAKEHSGYKARVRGGTKTSWISSVSEEADAGLDTNAEISYAKGGRLVKSAQSCEESDASLQDQPNDQEEPDKSSWMQTLSEIPYEDVITAHSVNFFVPLILCRELLPIMGELSKEHSDDPDFHDSSESSNGSETDATEPLGHIINVSSREGIFESLAPHISKPYRPSSTTATDSEARFGSSHGPKNGRHVHTNASKAALNMITETEAASAWNTRCVAMNTVDPGFMSAAPEIKNQDWFEKQGGPPLGFEDGTARVLWPVAVSWGKDRDRRSVPHGPIVGRLLKHFGEVDVEVP